MIPPTELLSGLCVFLTLWTCTLRVSGSVTVMRCSVGLSFRRGSRLAASHQSTPAGHRWNAEGGRYALVPSRLSLMESAAAVVGLLTRPFSKRAPSGTSERRCSPRQVAWGCPLLLPLAEPWGCLGRCPPWSSVSRPATCLLLPSCIMSASDALSMSHEVFRTEVLMRKTNRFCFFFLT